MATSLLWHTQHLLPAAGSTSSLFNSSPGGTVHIYLKTTPATELYFAVEGCRIREVGDRHGEWKTDVAVALCNEPESANTDTGPNTHRRRAAAQQDGQAEVGQAEVAAQQDGQAEVAMCIPPLYGDPALQLAAAEKHISYHRKLGVSRTFLYTTLRHDGWTPPRGTSLLHIAWADAFPIHSRAQNWQINDCVHRAAALGIAWALNIDIDEFLVLPPRWTLLDLVRREGNASDVLTFGSRRGASIGIAAANPPDCKDATIADPNLCPAHLGHRKHLSRTAAVWSANVHYVAHCKAGPCRQTNLSAAHTFLAHLGRESNYEKMPSGR